MKRKLLPLIILLALGALALGAGAPAQEKHQAALGSLVEAEREFCKTSIARGIREAFIENLADDATLFRPHAVAGKKWMTEQPAVPGLLTWEPVFADVAQSGDLGYTTGPWEFRKNGPDDKDVAHGNYMTIWKKQPDGAWKAVMDFGISNPPPTSKPAGLDSPATQSKYTAENKRVDMESELAALISLDREFSKTSAAKGAVNAYDSFLSDEARVYRDNMFPLIGKRAARAVLSAQKGVLIWQPTKANVSSAADLGYTFGVAELKNKGSDKIEYSNYVRIWKKQSGAWKVVLDVMNPAPPPASASR
jgi:ketosteroid isomerase-like protein